MSEPWEEISLDDDEVEDDSISDSSAPEAPNTYGIVRRLASSDRITPVFMGHSADDNVVSFEQGLQACQVINRIGLDINFECYPQGTTNPPHWLTQPLGIDHIGTMVQDYQERQNSLVVLSIVLTTIATFTVLVRFIIRFFMIHCPSYDDYAILVAVVFSIGYMVEILVAKENHIGFPASSLTLDNMFNLLKDALAIEVTYNITIGFVKVSILCMYLRFALAVVFGTGAFAAIVSVVRLRSIYTYTFSTDPYRGSIDVNFWSVIEVNVAILCASVPALKPIFTPHHLRELRRRNQYRYRGRDDSSYGGNSNKDQISRKRSNATGRADLYDLSTLSPHDRSNAGSPNGDRMDNTVDDCDEGGSRSVQNENKV
ncbi:hypothetical protein VP1G_00890 [Cytospora mali]|uniref:Rhodopsin domain-containing protein n=1 Tax=Cytospora mali TaxID=578113 RepID=A0A194UP95_CYTMA|nr:hypothetical protein VP1G_00890 [Valsa mali var. pyri (nom. inval.)]